MVQLEPVEFKVLRARLELSARPAFREQLARRALVVSLALLVLVVLLVLLAIVVAQAPLEPVGLED